MDIHRQKMRTSALRDQAWKSMERHYDDFARLSKTGLPTNETDVRIIQMGLSLIAGEISFRVNAVADDTLDHLDG